MRLPAAGLEASGGYEAVALAPRTARKDYITAKYIERRFARKRHADSAARLHGLCEAVKARDIFGLLQAHADGVDLTDKVPLANGHVSARRGRAGSRECRGRGVPCGGRGRFPGAWAPWALGAGPQRQLQGHVREERPVRPCPAPQPSPRPTPEHSPDRVGLTSPWNLLSPRTGALGAEREESVQAGAQLSGASHPHWNSPVAPEEAAAATCPRA